MATPLLNSLINSIGAYEKYPSNPPFNHQNPFWKNIGNNQEPEKVLTKDATDWKLRTYPNPVSSGEQVTISLENGNLVQYL